MKYNYSIFDNQEMRQYKFFNKRALFFEFQKNELT